MAQYTRKNAYDANNGGEFTNPDGSYTDLYWYAIGVREMKKKPISDPTSWWFYAAIHGEYLTDYFGSGSAPTYYPNWRAIQSIPASANLSNLPTSDQIQLFWNQCQHGTWYFAPWHRGYLLALENILRDIIVKKNGPADWALPYWNYLNQSTQYDEKQIPKAFTNIPLPDPDGDGSLNPLFVPERWPNIVVGPSNNGNGTNLNDECQWDTIYSISSNPQNNPITPPDNLGTNIYGDHWGGAETQFSHSNGGFGDLEMNPHNFLHNMCGGNKSEPNFKAYFTVDSTKPWQSTGLTIKPGNTYAISYNSGSWTADPNDNNGNLYDANGSPDIIVSPSQPLYPMVNVPMGALVGRVNGGTPFLVDDGSVVPDDVSGELELCINDDLTGAYGVGLTNNEGSIIVTITNTSTEEYEGLMADTGLAGLDPIFFLHHANIDRMWAAWNAHGNRNPKDLKWLKGPGTTAGNEFAMPMDDSGTKWVYTPEEVQDISNIKYYNGVDYSYTYDDLSLTSYSNKPPASRHAKKVQRLAKLGVVDAANEISMPNNVTTELVGTSNNGIVINEVLTNATVKIDGKAWSATQNSFENVSENKAPDEIMLLLENVKGTNNSNIITVYVNNTPIKSVSLFGIRRASMKDSSHGGAGLTFKFNITSVVDDLFVNNNINIESLDVQLRLKNVLAGGSKLTVGRISIYRIGQ